MKKQKQYIIISIGTIAVLSLAFFLISKMPSKEEGNTSSSKTLISIVDVNSDEIRNVSVKNSAGEYNIKVENADNTITYSIDKFDETKKLSKEKIDGVINTLSRFSAIEKVEESGDDLSKFGLDNPKASVKLTFADEGEKTLHLGNDAPLNAGTYIKVDDDNTVYLVKKQSTNLFLNSASYYVDTSPESSEKNEEGSEDLGENETGGLEENPDENEGE